MEYLSPFLRAYLHVLAGVLGAVLGSFVNCWAWRSQHGESVLESRSHCTSCGHVLGPADLVPVLSWAFSRGRCRYCGAPVSVRYPLTELASAGCFVAILAAYGLSPETLELWAFACVLLFLSLTDLDSYLIPNACIACAVGIRTAYLALALACGWMSVAQAASYVLSAVGVMTALLVTVLVFDHVMGRESMGGGDLKLFAVAAYYVGWQQSLLLVIVSCLLGLASFAAFFKAADAAEDAGAGEAPHRSKPFPFGPSIAAACVVTLVVGRAVVAWYLGLF